MILIASTIISIYAFFKIRTGLNDYNDYMEYILEKYTVNENTDKLNLTIFR